MTAAIEQQVEGFQRLFTRVKQEVAKVIVGYDDVIECVIMALLANGHVLLEGVPGLGKTRLVSTLSDVVHLKFSRIQFTPDLMPADITGTNIVQENAHGEKFLQFQQGPIFANIVLADEINRATPKTQSALLEAMEEKTVSVGKTTYKLDPPFFVLATQNPLEMEGTYPLPEAQLDRFFMKLKVDYPTLTSLHTILNRTTQIPGTAGSARAGRATDPGNAKDCPGCSHCAASSGIRDSPHDGDAPEYQVRACANEQICPAWRKPAQRPGHDRRRKDSRASP